MRIVGINKVGSTFHDFPHLEGSKCPHVWIINVTPAGKPHCIHDCPFCYARWMVYSDRSWDAPLRYYKNLDKVVEEELERYTKAPPVYLSSVTDVCQRVEPVREISSRVISLLSKKGLSISVTTKGDPGFILDIMKERGFERFVLQVSIEGPEEVIKITSPRALSFKDRLKVVENASKKGVTVIIRLDPFFYHLYIALFGDRWPRILKDLAICFKNAGAQAVIGSTGRFSGRDFYNERGELLGRDFDIYMDICQNFGLSRGIVEREHVVEKRRGIKGIWLRRELVSLFHLTMRRISKDISLEYTACDGDGSCNAFSLPFVVKVGDRFEPIPNCNGRCKTCNLNYSFCHHLKHINGPLKQKHLMINLSPIERFLISKS